MLDAIGKVLEKFIKSRLTEPIHTNAAAGDVHLKDSSVLEKRDAPRMPL